MVNEAKQKPPRRYEKMRDSGVAWIGMVPEHWQVQKAKRFVVIANGSDPKTEGNIPVYGSGATSFKTCGEYRIGPAVLVGRKGSINNPRYVEGLFWNVDTAFDVKSKNESAFLTKYYFYLSVCFDYNYYGSQTTVPSMTQESYNNMFLPYPPVSVQQCLVDYLGEKCSQIEQIVADIKASIEEYKAWKASIIYEAVTKGLDPHAEMKDSGVEWIGKIPKHWGTTALKRICKRISDGSHYSPPTTAFGLPYVTAGDIHGKGINYTKCRTISKSDFDLLVKTNCQPHLGDVLLVKDGATTGRVGLMTDDGPCVLLSSVAMLTPNDGISSEYLMYLLESDVFQYQIKKTMAGSAMPRTTLSKLMVYTAILCPFDEQVEIVNYLNAKCSHIEDLISEKLSLISDLESYKKSLIYEVVTGKRKVC